MEIGDVYDKHIRGSRYVFNHDGIYYQIHANGQKLWSKNFDESMLSRLLSLKGTGGRLYINEKREMVIFKKSSEDRNTVWIPIFAGILKEDMEFNIISINPKGLSPGLLWPGFNSHHGSKFKINYSGKLVFKETWKDKYGIKRSVEYPVKTNDKDLLEIVKRVNKYKHGGAFFLNEYGHVWAPIQLRYFDMQMKMNPEFYNKFNRQWKFMPSEIKRIIKKYMDSDEREYIPIYAGEYHGDINIVGREDKPHIIYEREESDWNEI